MTERRSGQRASCLPRRWRIGAADWIGKAFLDFESLYLPLSDDGETVNMVLGAVTFELAAPLKPQG